MCEKGCHLKTRCCRQPKWSIYFFDDVHLRYFPGIEQTNRRSSVALRLTVHPRKTVEGYRESFLEGESPNPPSKRKQDHIEMGSNSYIREAANFQPYQSRPERRGIILLSVYILHWQLEWFEIERIRPRVKRLQDTTMLITKRDRGWPASSVIPLFTVAKKC